MPMVYVRFVAYIVLFSTIVSLTTSVANYSLQFRDLDRDIAEHAAVVENNIRDVLRFDIRDVHKDIASITHNPIFIAYLQHRDAKTRGYATNLLLSHAEANQRFFQVRFIDKTGMEQIRIEKPTASDELLVAKRADLQDKSGRYYFRDTMAMPAGQAWHSKLDLNIEHGQIERPLRPTLRVSIPAFSDGEIAGIVIVNVDMSRTLSLIAKNPDFNVFLVDGEGYFLKHPQDELSWGRYLKSDELAQSRWPEFAEKILARPRFDAKGLYAFSLEDQITNGENIHAVLEAKDVYVAALKKHNVRVALYLALMILAIAIPVGMLLALWPARVQRALSEALEQNARQLGVIDRYVISCEIGADGTIADVSSALCQLSGHAKDELIGQPRTLLFADEANRDAYDDIQSCIAGGLSWHGELKGHSRDGAALWLDTVVLPKLDDGALTGFAAISTDVTDKKRIAKISEEDHLTGLYNRVKLDEVLSTEAGRAHRYNAPFSAILIDADHFKSVNDRFGHLVGDEVLKSFADILRQHTRSVDVVGRWGGEEFIVLCTETAMDGAVALAEKLRHEIDLFDFEPAQGQTASFGVTAFLPSDSVETFVKRLDDALYRAKANGRNRVEAQ